MTRTEVWDQWWKERGTSGKLPMLPAPMIEYDGRAYDVANRDDLLIAIMTACGLRTVLCAGCGVSQEPRALARAGFDVTALDISAVAVEVAANDVLDSGGFFYFCGGHPQKAGGRLNFVLGDIFETSVCSGPFDVVIERRVIQVMPEEERPAALGALAQRLSGVGILLSLCLDDPFPPALGWVSDPGSGLFHASESWFRRERWTIWDDAPILPLNGRVAWLVRSGSMKRPPG